jgi:hypothetical protein
MSETHTLHSPAKKNRIIKWFACGILVLFVFFLRGCLPGGTGVIARVKSSNGVEMSVVQKYNEFFEPYETGFYYRKPGKPWGWFYYDHEDTRWSFARIKLSDYGNLAHVYRGFEEVARFEIPTESFTLLRWKRTLSPAQEWMPEGWKPEDALSDNGAKSPMQVGAPNNLSPPGYEWK